jgi:hypothetical protein
MLRDPGREASVNRDLSQAPGVIAIAELYHLEEAKARLRWNETAMRTARRNGLKIRYCGGRGYVFGSDIHSYIAENDKDSK